MTASHTVELRSEISYLANFAIIYRQH